MIEMVDLLRYAPENRSSNRKKAIEKLKSTYKAQKLNLGQSTN